MLGFLAGALLGSAIAAAGSVSAAAWSHRCGWADRLSRDTRNTLFIDEAATYWTASVPIPEGAHLEVAGEFAYARYLSLAVYDTRARTVDHVVDHEIAPDEGAINPFVLGAVRDAPARGFTLRVLDAAVPDDGRAPNTLYTESADGSRSTRGRARLTLRIYAPDRQRSASGGVPLPAITVVGAGGDRTTLTECLDTARDEVVPPGGTGFAVPGGRGSDPPAWDRFLPDGLGENVDNSYVYETFMPSLGPVLALNARAPTTPVASASDGRMDEGELRYWSLCANLLTTAVHTCLRDDEIPVDEAGDFSVVVSRVEDRPANATTECGVAWLEAAPETDTILVYRHMLPDPSFSGAISRVEPGAEEETMGDYYPTGTYYESAADYEARGCDRVVDDREAAANATDVELGADRGGSRIPVFLGVAVAVGIAGLVMVSTQVLRRRDRHTPA